jgi:aryl-alcohol dehydrogenase-like predicted oxidoreductase
MRYQLFGHTGLRVSELALGTMTFGTEWGWGANYDTSKQIFDAYANAGGNFLDTANRYTEGTSERWLSEFIGTERDHFVLATKYTLFDRKTDPNYSGNHRKNLIRSVHESLKRLRTDFIDLLWVHAWDFTTSVEEVMRGLDDLVRQGKVHYIGISDTPAWIVAQANTMADLRGWTAFAGLQIEYSLIERTPERELLPMAKALDLAVTPWASLGSGVLTGKYLNKETGRLKENSIKLNDRNAQIAQEVVNIAQEIGASPAQVAINWTRQGREQVLIPILGASKLSQIEDNLACVNVELSGEQLERLNQKSAIELGFPHDFLERARMNIFGETYDLLDNHRR